MSFVATVLLAATGFFGLNFFTSYIVNTLILPFSVGVAALISYQLIQFDPLEEDNLYGVMMYGSAGISAGVVTNVLLNKFAGSISNSITLAVGVIFILFLYNPGFLGSIVGKAADFVGGD